MMDRAAHQVSTGHCDSGQEASLPRTVAPNRAQCESNDGYNQQRDRQVLEPEIQTYNCA